MRRLLPALALLLAGCPADDPVSPIDQVDLLLYTPACEPESEPPFENWMNDRTELTISWDVLCHRDAAETAWFAVKVSLWEDRADDLWNLWYIEPELRAVTYGEEGVPGVTNAQNPDSPDAQVRVEPRELVAGEYRVEVWEVPDNTADATVAEAKLTVLGDAE